MKLTVKTLKGTHFEIRVQPNDSVRYSDPHFVLKSSRASYRGASYRERVRGCERLWRGGWFLRHSDGGRFREELNILLEMWISCLCMLH